MSANEDMPSEQAVTHTDVKIIMVVEDDIDIGDIIVSTIEDETPYHATLCSDAFEALKTVRSLKPNLFVLDYNLPGMNGLELYDKLQELPALRPIPTLMMSANFPRGELEKRNLPCIHKPFDINDLLNKISALVS